MNKHKNNKLIVIVVVFICIIFSKVSVSADALNEASPETLAVALVIDTSGSMASTDPKKLRETAANIFIDLLSPDDYLSIITFNTKQEVVLPMKQLQSSDNKAAVKKTLSQKLQTTGDTDYLAALNEASRQLSSVNKGNVRKVILFLTDGEPDPNGAKKKNTAFMNSYMDSLWKGVSDLSLNKYVVYSVGFSKGVDSSILERISSTTHGGLKISDDSSELALSFFDILGNLKSSKEFLNKTIELKGSSNLDFDMDEYTSQATMVFTNPGGLPLDVNLSAPEGKDAKSAATINKSDKYTIVTVNQKDEKLPGKWQINLKGNGSIKAFGSKDLFVKSWISSPETNSLHPLNEPLEISVNVTGETKENISVEALVTKEGIQDKTPVRLEIKDRVFTGTYKNVDKAGKYDLEIRLMLNGQVVAKNNTSFVVKELPSITTDFLGKDIAYRLGEKFTASSSLNMAGNKILKGSDIKIENYNLLLDYVKSGTQTIPLLDNGSADAGDAKAEDGIWSNKLLFDKEDSGKASLIVNGTYKGERFLLEKPLGNFKVYQPGKLLIKPLGSRQIISSNGELKIPLEIENTSNFIETMIISLDKSIGKLDQDRIKIEPLKTVKTYINVKLDKNLKKKIYDITFKVSAEDDRTKVEPGEFCTSVQVLSKTGYLLKSLKDNAVTIIILLGIAIGTLLLIVFIGFILYKLFVYNNAIIQGKLIYWKESDTELEDKREFDFGKLGKDKIVITFNKENKKAQYHIFESEYKYDIELTSVIQKSKWKFMDGYKTMFNMNNGSELMLRTTEPGIFTYEGKIYSRKKIYKNDRFATGGYVFEYRIVNKSRSIGKDRGKNLLKGLQPPFSIRG